MNNRLKKPPTETTTEILMIGGWKKAFCKYREQIEKRNLGKMSIEKASWDFEDYFKIDGKVTEIARNSRTLVYNKNDELMEYLKKFDFDALATDAKDLEVQIMNNFIKDTLFGFMQAVAFYEVEDSSGIEIKLTKAVEHYCEEVLKQMYPSPFLIRYCKKLYSTLFQG